MRPNFFLGLFSGIAECFSYSNLYDSFLFEICPGQTHIWFTWTGLKIIVVYLNVLS